MQQVGLVLQHLLPRVEGEDGHVPARVRIGSASCTARVASRLAFQDTTTRCPSGCGCHSSGITSTGTPAFSITSSGTPRSTSLRVGLAHRRGDDEIGVVRIQRPPPRGLDVGGGVEGAFHAGDAHLSMKVSVRWRRLRRAVGVVDGGVVDLDAGQPGAVLARERDRRLQPRRRVVPDAEIDQDVAERADIGLRHGDLVQGLGKV